MNSKMISRVLFISLLSFSFFSSCKREVDMSIISVNAPSLKVNVTNQGGSAFSGATVALYNNQTSWNAETGSITSKTTDAGGYVIFTKDELKDPGVFYLITTSGSLKVKTTTSYLLLNDGETNVNVSLK